MSEKDEHKLTKESEKIAEIVSRLQQPTPHEHIKFLPKGMKSKDGERYFAMAIPYVDIAFVRQRMDDACGPFGWKSEAAEVNGLSFCGLSILNPVTEEWISRWDTGQDDAWHDNGKQRIEGEKFSMGARGIFSIGFKRSAYQWGVARDVLSMRVYRCECDVWTDNAGKPHFKGWVENPLVKQVEEMRNRQALPPATDSIAGLKPVVDGGSEVSKYEDVGARKIAGQCRDAAIYACGMTPEQYKSILEDYEQDGGCRTETYADLFNSLQDYRRVKLTVIKEANSNIAVNDKPYDMSDDLHEQVTKIVNLA